MGFRFGIPNMAFRKRMSWSDFTVACVVGVIAGIYTFKPGLKQAKEAIERREALKEIQARRKAEVEKGYLTKLLECNSTFIFFKDFNYKQQNYFFPCFVFK
jgi:hypothetical protein